LHYELSVSVVTRQLGNILRISFIENKFSFPCNNFILLHPAMLPNLDVVDAVILVFATSVVNGCLSQLTKIIAFEATGILLFVRFPE
jgi:hypothetical protein